MAAAPPAPGPLRRIVTGHNGSQGQAVIKQDTDIVPQSQSSTGAGARFGQIWTVDGAQYNLNDERDLAQDGHAKDNIVVPGGSRLTVVDYPPGVVSPLHRTVSLDYAIVMKGSIILHLDDGSTTVANEGDIIVQRGTMHAWENPSSSDWARVVFHVAAAQGPYTTPDGKALGEEFNSPPKPYTAHLQRNDSNL